MSNISIIIGKRLRKRAGHIGPNLPSSGGEGGVQVRRGKNPRQGESLDRDKD